MKVKKGVEGVNENPCNTQFLLLTREMQGILIYIDMTALRFVSVKVRQIISLIGL